MLAVAVLAAAACAGDGGSSLGTGSCAASTVRPLVERLMAEVAQWDDQVVIATNVARLSLAPEVAKLQEIRRSTQALDGPTCFARVRDLGVEYMNATIELYLAFLGQQSTVGLTDVPRVTRAKFDDAVRSLRGSVGLTVTASPAPTAFRITRKASEIVISDADVGSDYVEGRRRSIPLSLGRAHLRPVLSPRQEWLEDIRAAA